MKLVIDIPDWYYSELQEFKHPNFVDKAIRDGVILPKGHGRLIDADALYEQYAYADCNFDMTMEYAPTIIEADKEE